MASVYTASKINLNHVGSVAITVQHNAYDDSIVTAKFVTDLGHHEITIIAAKDVHREFHRQLGAALGIEAGDA